MPDAQGDRKRHSIPRTRVRDSYELPTMWMLRLGHCPLEEQRVVLTVEPSLKTLTELKFCGNKMYNFTSMIIPGWWSESGVYFVFY